MKEQAVKQAKAKAEAELAAVKAEGEESVKKALQDADEQIASLKRDAGQKTEEAIAAVIAGIA